MNTLFYKKKKICFCRIEDLVLTKSSIYLLENNIEALKTIA